MKKYEIVTIEDISKMITRENFQNFFTDMINVYDKYLKIKEDLPKMEMPSFTWIDDNENNIFATLNGVPVGKGIDAYFKDLEDYENKFQCNECGEDEKSGFGYNRTVANGEVWTCKNCKTEKIVSNKPNEDDY